MVEAVALVRGSWVMKCVMSASHDRLPGECPPVIAASCGLTGGSTCGSDIRPFRISQKPGNPAVSLQDRVRCLCVVRVDRQVY